MQRYLEREPKLLLLGLVADDGHFRLLCLHLIWLAQTPSLANLIFTALLYNNILWTAIILKNFVYLNTILSHYSLSWRPLSNVHETFFILREEMLDMVSTDQKKLSKIESELEERRQQLWKTQEELENKRAEANRAQVIIGFCYKAVAYSSCHWFRA